MKTISREFKGDALILFGRGLVHSYACDKKCINNVPNKETEFR